MRFYGVRFYGVRFYGGAVLSLKAHIETLVQIRTQDLEPDPTRGGSRIREGVAADRRVSLEDKEMRHGRILARTITPANRPEDEALPSLTGDMAHQGFDVDHRLLDRGHINSTLVDDVLGRRGTICAPWKSRNGRLFPRQPSRSTSAPARSQTSGSNSITVPNAKPCTCVFGHSIRCPLRTQCTTAEFGNGRSVAIAENEPLQQRLRTRIRTSAGRHARRARTTIEHTLAHISHRQGNEARCIGVRKNIVDLRRANAIQNLETLHRSAVDRERRRKDVTFKPFTF